MFFNVGTAGFSTPNYKEKQEVLAILDSTEDTN